MPLEVIMADQYILEVKVIEEKRGASWVKTNTGGYIVKGMPAVGDMVDDSAIIFQEDDPMQATSRFYKEQVLGDATEGTAVTPQHAKPKRLWFNRQNLRIIWLVIQVVVIVALIIVFGGFLIQALF